MRKQTQGIFTANVSTYRQCENKRREYSRQMWSAEAETTTNAGKSHGKCFHIPPERKQTPGIFTANVSTYRQCENKRRKITRQMWSNKARAKTNAGNIHGKCGQLRPKRQQTPENHTANVVKTAFNHNRKFKLFNR